MSRKDYELLAAAIQQALHQHPGEAKGIKRAAEAVANALARDNDRFKRSLFIEACGFPLPLSS